MFRMTPAACSSSSSQQHESRKDSKEPVRPKDGQTARGGERKAVRRGVRKGTYFALLDHVEDDTSCLQHEVGGKDGQSAGRQTVSAVTAKLHCRT